jgi:ATP-dependent DNA helicase 2 subunit 2
LVTNAASPVSGVDDADDITKSLAEMGCAVHVIGIDFGLSEGDLSAKYGAEVAEIKSENEKLLKTLIVDDVNMAGRVSSVSNSLDLMSIPRAKAVRSVTLCRCPLEIGTELAFDIFVYPRTRPRPLPSLKKESSFMEDGGTGKVAMDRTYRSMEDTDRVLDPEERSRAYKYGKDLVPITTELEDSLKYASPKCLKLLQFVPKGDVPRFYFKGPPNSVVPAPGNGFAAQGINALAIALEREGKVAFARYWVILYWNILTDYILWTRNIFTA